MYSYAHIFKDTQTERCAGASMQTRTWGMQTPGKGTCTQKRRSWDTATSSHVTGGIQKHTRRICTQKKKKYVWQSVGALRECPVHRPSEAGRRVSLQENIYIEAYIWPVTVRCTYATVDTYSMFRCWSFHWIVRGLCFQWHCFQKSSLIRRKTTWLCCRDCRYENTCPYV